MEVTVLDKGSGRSCVVSVSDIDTVMSLKVNALDAIFAPTGDVGSAWHTLRIGGEEGVALHDDERICDTPLEHGVDVELVQCWAAVKSPASYNINDTDYSATSPCGGLCCVGRAGGISVVDTTTAEVVAQVEHEGDGAFTPMCVAFSWCGAWVASGSAQSKIKIYSTEVGEECKVLEGHSDGSVFYVAWSRCGRLVSGSNDRTVRVWDVQEGVCTAVLEGHTRTIYGIAVSRSSIFSGSADSTIRVWDFHSLGHSGTLEGHTDEVNDVKLSIDEQLLVSCSEDGSTRIWCTDTLALLHVLTGRDAFYSGVVARAGDIVLGLSDEDLLLWQLSTEECVRVVAGMDNSYHIHMSPCERWVFISETAGVKVLSVDEILCRDTDAAQVGQQ